MAEAANSYILTCSNVQSQSRTNVNNTSTSSTSCINLFSVSLLKSIKPYIHLVVPAQFPEDWLKSTTRLNKNPDTTTSTGPNKSENEY